MLATGRDRRYFAETYIRPISLIFLEEEQGLKSLSYLLDDQGGAEVFSSLQPEPQGRSVPLANPHAHQIRHFHFFDFRHLINR